MKHTKGTWEVFNNNSVKCEGYGKVAWCSNEANAKLIAAAPDLLDACNLAYELLNVGQPLGNDDLDKLFNAIKKATE